MARPKRNDNTREKLLEQGLKLFIDQGYHATGIKEVVDLVQVPKGSFYNYFDSKEQFGAEVIRHYSRWLIAHLAKSLNNSHDDALVSLKHFFAQEAERHQTHKVGCAIGNLGAELGASSQLCQDAMIEGLEGMKQQFLPTLKRGQAQGSIRQDIPAEELADFLIDAYEGALLRMQVKQSVEPIRQLGTRLSHYLV